MKEIRAEIMREKLNRVLGGSKEVLRVTLIDILEKKYEKFQYKMALK